MALRTNSTLNAGDCLGDYEVIEPLGAGGMGAVFKVRHRISHRIEALKIILPEASGPPLTGDRFLREIRLLAGLQHVNIGGFYNAFRMGDQFAMAMEFIEGVSLRALLSKRRLNIAQTSSYGAQILSALAYAHARGVIHRDVKPSNVMIQVDGLVKLLDFGLAISQMDSELTQPGTLLGSPHYMSPEQACGQKADARSDLYSTGAVLYEMASGRPLFEVSGTHALIAAHVYQLPQPLHEIDATVPVDFSKIVMKAVVKNPADRFQTAQEFLAALEATGLASKTLAVDPDRRTAVTTETMPPPGEGSAISSAEVDQVSKSLALYIGPIAQIIVKRAAAESRTLQELYQRVSDEIGSQSQRQEFLGKMPAKSVSRSAS